MTPNTQVELDVKSDEGLKKTTSKKSVEKAKKRIAALERKMEKSTWISYIPNDFEEKDAREKNEKVQKHANALNIVGALVTVA